MKRSKNMYTPNEKRYEKMIYNRCGKSGLKLPAVSLGFWQNFGSKGCFENMEKMVHTAFDLGITHFDLANNYGNPYNGSAEENFGRILDGMRQYRDEMCISTKAGFEMWDGPYGDRNGSRKYLTASLDQSLKRMKLEYVDIFYHHVFDPNTPLEETALALDNAVKQGKALYVGISNYDGVQLKKAEQLLTEMHCPFIINQNKYSIFDRTIEKNGLKETAPKLGLGIIAYSPLAQGLLTDKYLHGIPQGSRIQKNSPYLTASSLTPEMLQKISALNDMAHERGESLAQMALNWILKDDALTSVLIGASSPAQIIENTTKIRRHAFTEEELQKIDRIVF